MRLASSMSTRSTPSPPAFQIPLPPHPSGPAHDTPTHPLSPQPRRLSHHHSSGQRINHPDRERLPSPKPSSASHDNSSGSSGSSGSKAARRRSSTPNGRPNGRKSGKDSRGGPGTGVGARENYAPQPTFVEESSSAPGGESTSSTTEGEGMSRWSRRSGLPLNTFSSSSANLHSTTSALPAPSSSTRPTSSYVSSGLRSIEPNHIPSSSRSRPQQSISHHHHHHRSSPPLNPTLLPIELHLSLLGTVSITRALLESSLVVAAVLGGAATLHQQGSLADHRGAFETIFITAISLTYFLLRSASTSSSSRQSSPKPTPSIIPPLPSQSRLFQAQTTSSQSSRSSRSNLSPSPFSLALFRGGSKGFVWGTDDRDYRDEQDDGALIALLFGPLVAMALLLTTLRQLSSPVMPTSALPSGWLVEEPLTIPSTLSSPVFISSDPSPSADTARIALEALAKSRRSMLSLASIMTVVVLLQLLFSRWAEAFHARKKLEDWEGANPNGSAVGGEKWWLPRSEWKRTGSVVSFAVAVSASMACLKVALRHFEVPIWTNLTIVDIFIASLFHQSSMYVCVRLARRGFTLGELGIVAQFSTALFMESVNLTRAKNSISFLSFLSTSYVQTYRLPTPLLIFQLALIPGSFLTGILLSPLLVLSRHISQKPSHRLRFPEEKLLHRRYLALSFYTGTIVIVGGAVGMWTKWQLGWRDPWMWAIWWMAEGSRWWSRLGLLGYWGTLAAISVGGWELQLAKARKGRAWISVGSNRNVIAVSASPALTPVTGKNEIPISTTMSSLGVESARPASSTVTARSFASTTASSTNGTTAGVEASSSTSRAGRMMGKVPILSLNGRRKFFHGLAVLMFIPGIYIDPGFTHLAFSFAFALFIFAEYVRYFALYPFGAIVHLFLNEFLDHKDSGTAILSHFYLLTGCALGVWLESPAQILSYVGVLTLGIGDALASIVGRQCGRIRWDTASGKTVEGTLAFFLGVFIPAIGLRVFGIVDELKYFKFAFTIALSALLEAWSNQNDNLVIPLYTWSVASLLG